MARGPPCTDVCSATLLFGQPFQLPVHSRVRTTASYSVLQRPRMQRAFWNSIGYTIIQTLIYTHGCADCSHHLTAYVTSAAREKNDHSHHPLHAWCAICASTYSRPRGPTRTNSCPRGRTSAHEGSRGLTRAHEGPRELTRAHEGSCKYCVGYAQYWSTDCTSDTSSSALTIIKSSTTLPMPTCYIKADGHSVLLFHTGSRGLKAPMEMTAHPPAVAPRLIWPALVLEASPGLVSNGVPLSDPLAAYA